MCTHRLLKQTFITELFVQQEQSVYLLQIFKVFYGKDFEFWPCSVSWFDTDVSDEREVSTFKINGLTRMFFLFQNFAMS